VGSLIFNFSGTRNTDGCNSLFGSASITHCKTRSDFVHRAFPVRADAVFAVLPQDFRHHL
jgi:hypothetical protein